MFTVFSVMKLNVLFRHDKTKIEITPLIVEMTANDGDDDDEYIIVKWKQ